MNTKAVALSDDGDQLNVYTVDVCDVNVDAVPFETVDKAGVPSVCGFENVTVTTALATPMYAVPDTDTVVGCMGAKDVVMPADVPATPANANVAVAVVLGVQWNVNTVPGLVPASVSIVPLAVPWKATVGNEVVSLNVTVIVDCTPGCGSIDPYVMLKDRLLWQSRDCVQCSQVVRRRNTRDILEHERCRCGCCRCHCHNELGVVCVGWIQYNTCGYDRRGACAVGKLLWIRERQEHVALKTDVKRRARVGNRHSRRIPNCHKARLVVALVAPYNS